MPNAWDAEQIVSVPLANTLIETQFPELAPAANFAAWLRL